MTPVSGKRRLWMLSDAIISYGDSISEQELAVLANGCLTAAHAAQFVAYVRQVRQAYSITKIINGTHEKGTGGCKGGRQYHSFH